MWEEERSGAARKRVRPGSEAVGWRRGLLRSGGKRAQRTAIWPGPNPARSLDCNRRHAQPGCLDPSLVPHPIRVVVFWRHVRKKASCGKHQQVFTGVSKRPGDGNKVGDQHQDQ
jgi:hypothetical protein